MSDLIKGTFFFVMPKQVRKTSQKLGRLPQKRLFLRVTCDYLGRLPHLIALEKRSGAPAHKKRHLHSQVPLFCCYAARD